MDLRPGSPPDLPDRPRPSSTGHLRPARGPVHAPSGGAQRGPPATRPRPPPPRARCLPPSLLPPSLPLRHSQHTTKVQATNKRPGGESRTSPSLCRGLMRLCSQRKPPSALHRRPRCGASITAGARHVQKRRPKQHDRAGLAQRPPPLPPFQQRCSLVDCALCYSICIELCIALCIYHIEYA